MSAKEIILYIISLYTAYLDELKTLPCTDFIHGEMTAYVETLEIIQMFQQNITGDLNYVIEEKYKI